MIAWLLRVVCAMLNPENEVDWIGNENEVDWIGVEERRGDW